MLTISEAGRPETFPTIFAAAQQAGISRVYGGIHYHISIETGLANGKNYWNKSRRNKIA